MEQHIGEQFSQVSNRKFMKAILRPSKVRNVCCITTKFTQFHKVQHSLQQQVQYTFKVITGIYLDTDTPAYEKETQRQCVGRAVTSG
jgi:hypothetical protein